MPVFYSYESSVEPIPVPVWDAEKVRRLIREVHWLGRKPAYILVGRREAMSLKAFLSSQFGEGEMVSLKNQTYAGLKIFEADAESQLVIEPA